MNAARNLPCKSRCKKLTINKIASYGKENYSSQKMIKKKLKRKDMNKLLFGKMCILCKKLKNSFTILIAKNVIQYKNLLK